MKRFMTATAIATLLATGASAQMATDAQRSILERYAPGYDISALSHDQVQSLLAIANGGDASHGEKSDQIQAMLSEMGVMMDETAMTTDSAAVVVTPPAGPSDIEIATIEKYLPDVDASLLSEDQVDSLIAIANGGSEEGQKQAEMESVLGIN